MMIPRRSLAIAIALLLIPTLIPGTFDGIRQHSPSIPPSYPTSGSATPFYFSNPSYPGYPSWTTINGQQALQLTPVSTGAYDGVAWQALNYVGQPVEVSMNGTYTQVAGAGLADGFKIIMFAQDGTGSMAYQNNTIPGLSGTSPCALSTSTGVVGSAGVSPDSTTQYFGLNWDPFYTSGGQFNLWVVNPPCTLATNSGGMPSDPGGIGCSIGEPTAYDIIRFNTTYVPATNTLEARISDLTSGSDCSFTRDLTSDGFVVPGSGNYWMIIVGANGGGEADWTLLQAQPFGVTLGPVVCLTPSVTATSCPFFPYFANLGSVSLGSAFTVGVFVQNSAPMGGFDIYVASDPYHLYPTDASLGSLITGPTFTSVCINRFRTTSYGCDDPGGISPGFYDGPGIVQVSTIATSGANQCGNISPCSGMAFTITYQAVGAIASTDVTFPTGTGACMTSSVSSPADVCVLIADAGGTPLSESVEGATAAVAKAQSRTATSVYDFSTSMAWTGTEVTGASAYDTAAVAGVTGVTPTGNVIYTYFTTSDCSGTGTSESPMGGSVLSGGAVPVSSVVGPLGAGTHSFQAVYSGDSNYLGSSSLCEPFALGKKATSTITAMYVTGTSSPDVQGTTQPLATMVYDSATTGPLVTGIPIAGTVSYYLSTSIYGCVSPFFGLWDTEPVNTPSITLPPSPAGIVAFEAVYSGDGNYAGSTSSCEQITVTKVSTSTTTTLFTFGGATIQPSGSVPLGTSVYDSVAVGPYVAPFQIGGSVSYTFFTSGDCSGAGISAGGGSFINGTPPPQSSAMGPLAAGSYSFGATYIGDANYVGSSSACEPFTVNKASTSISVVLGETYEAYYYDGTPYGNTWTIPSSWNFATLGALLSVSSTVGTQVGNFAITGTITYSYLSQPVPVGQSPQDFGPLGTGLACITATYNGDSNYASSSTTLCFPVTIPMGGGGSRAFHD